MEPLGYRSTALHSAERRKDAGFKEGLRIMVSIKNRRSGSEALRGRITRRDLRHDHDRHTVSLLTGHIVFSRNIAGRY